MEIIKRYQNRKLYSTTLSKYVTMSYIIDLVRTNQKFMVINNKDKTDITSKTIKHSLVEVPISLDAMTTLIKGSY